MHAFNYQHPKSVADAAAALSKGGDAKLLAGGQSLIAAMKLRLSAPTDLIDLGGIKELTGIKVEGASITIGAMTRHAEVARSKDVQAKIPALASLAGGIGDRMVRNMGTLGGSLAHNDPVADYPAAVLALGATVNTNKRKIAADDFFKGMFETALQSGEIIVSVSFPVPKRRIQRVPRHRNGESACGEVVARRGCRHQRAGGQAQLRYARERRVPFASHHGDGAPRGGGGEVSGFKRKDAKGAKDEIFCALFLLASAASWTFAPVPVAKWLCSIPCFIQMRAMVCADSSENHELLPDRT